MITYDYKLDEILLKYTEVYLVFTSSIEQTKIKIIDIKLQKKKNFIDSIFFVDHMKKAVQYFQNEKFIEATESFVEASRYCGIKDIEKEMKINEGMCYFSLKNYAKAIEMCDESLKINSEYSQAKNAKAFALNELGAILMMEKKYADAIDKFEEANDLFMDDSHPRRSAFLLNMGICFKTWKIILELLKCLIKL